MNQDLIQKLNNLKFIEPDAVFVKKCRSEILALKPRKPFAFAWPVLIWSGGFAVLLIAAILSFTTTTQKQLPTTSLNSHKLNQEFDNLTINIQLQEIRYQQNINQTIASALNEIGDTNTKHLNSSILEKEKSDLLNVNQSQNPEIDQLLESVIF